VAASLPPLLEPGNDPATESLKNHHGTDDNLCTGAAKTERLEVDTSACIGGPVTNETAAGQGWWLASDGSWYPPELHPNATGASTSRDWHPAGSALKAPAKTAIPVPTLPTRRSIAVEQPSYRPIDRSESTKAVPPVVAQADVPESDAVSARSPEPAPGSRVVPEKETMSTPPVPGPQLPDLFEQAMQGSSMADMVRVGPPVPDDDGALWDPTAAYRAPDESDVAPNPVPAGVGSFKGARARRRWRIHH
jgi:hypothetical protein